ncbi:MAG: CPBP family intramembrane metalloprotease [Rhodobacteraceae bacterium]|nr:CPBP family intramembrane metalloprotease [Paracoccaceae bacterium]
MRYDAQHAWVEPARPRAALWRLVIGVILSLAIYASFIAGAGILAGLVAPYQSETVFFEIEQGADTPRAMLVLLFHFVFFAAAPLIVARVLHGLGPIMVTGPLSPLVRDFLKCLRNLVLLSVVMMLILVGGEGEAPIQHLEFGHWLVLLPFALLGVLIQTSAEEIAFRGYIQQQLAARFRSPLMWMVMPSVLFGMGHYAQVGFGANAWFVVAWAAAFGCAAADLTARAGNLGPAIAFHFANNVIAVVLVALPDNMSGLALYHYPFDGTDAEALQPYILLDLVYLGVAWLACRVALRR